MQSTKITIPHDFQVQVYHESHRDKDLILITIIDKTQNIHIITITVTIDLIQDQIPDRDQDQDPEDDVVTIIALHQLTENFLHPFLIPIIETMSEIITDTTEIQTNLTTITIIITIITTIPIHPIIIIVFPILPIYPQHIIHIEIHLHHLVSITMLNLYETSTIFLCPTIPLFSLSSCFVRTVSLLQ